MANPPTKSKSPIERARKRDGHYFFFWRFLPGVACPFVYWPRSAEHQNGMLEVFRVQKMYFFKGTWHPKWTQGNDIGSYEMERIEAACRLKWPGVEGYLSSNAATDQAKAAERRKNWKPRGKVTQMTKPVVDEGSDERTRRLALIIAADVLTFTSARAGNLPSKAIGEMAYAGYTESEILKVCQQLGGATDELFWFSNSHLGWDGKSATRADIVTWIESRQATWAA